MDPLNRGLEQAWLHDANNHQVVARFWIEESTASGKKRIDFQDGAGAEDAPRTTIATNLSHEYAIGCVMRILRVYESGSVKLLPAGICDNTSNVKGVHLS